MGIFKNRWVLLCRGDVHMKSAKLKYANVRNEIEREIREGRFSAAGRLPPEKELAALYGVSYMTARKAVTELVAAKLIERRAGVGAYVRSSQVEFLATPHVNLICHSMDSNMLRAFLMEASSKCSELGWRTRTIRISPGYEDSAIRALESDDRAIVLIPEGECVGPLKEAIVRSADRTVSIGIRLDQEGVVSILSDDTLTVRTAVEHLKAAGHRRIALMVDGPGSNYGNLIVASWKSCFPEESPATLNQRLFFMSTPDYESSLEYAYKATRTYLRRDRESGREQQVTALVCQYPEIALAALAACRDEGCPVPEKMSMVCLEDSPHMLYCYPSVTSINRDMGRHVDLALTALQASMSGTMDTIDRFLMAQSELRSRLSVEPPAENN
jgi:DNA-binding LacI/PurR family transcriptional regulator